jgi:hypothetical protein
MWRDGIWGHRWGGLVNSDPIRFASADAKRPSVRGRISGSDRRARVAVIGAAKEGVGVKGADGMG